MVQYLSGTFQIADDNGTDLCKFKRLERMMTNSFSSCRLRTYQSRLYALSSGSIPRTWMRCCPAYLAAARPELQRYVDQCIDLDRFDWFYDATAEDGHGCCALHRRCCDCGCPMITLRDLLSNSLQRRAYFVSVGRHRDVLRSGGAAHSPAQSGSLSLSDLS